MKYKGYTLRVMKSLTGRVNRVVIIGQHVEFKTIKSAKEYIQNIA